MPESSDDRNHGGRYVGFSDWDRRRLEDLERRALEFDRRAQEILAPLNDARMQLARQQERYETAEREREIRRQGEETQRREQIAGLREQVSRLEGKLDALTGKLQELRESTDRDKGVTSLVVRGFIAMCALVLTAVVMAVTGVLGLKK